MKRQLTEAAEISSSDEEADEDAGSRPTKARFSSRLGKCEVCAAKDARYACPKCEVKTCSVACVQIHKKELNCSGIRDRTKFIAIRNMTNMDFMSDYYFLEEATRFAQTKAKGNKRFTRYNKALPESLFRMRAAALERRIKLRFLLPNFTRSKENTTFYDWKLRKLFWRVAWIFSNACGLKYVDERCDENVPLHKLLDKYLNAESTEMVPQKKELEYYQSVGVSGVKILLKAEGVKRSRSRYYLLDVAKTLKQNLAGKTIVEYPHIYLSYEAQPDAFDIIDSDEDVEAEAKAYESQLNEQIKQQTTAKAPPDTVDGAKTEQEKSLYKLLSEKRQHERRRKRAEYEKNPGNFLFEDEQLWDILSSSDDEKGGHETEAENY